MNAWYGQIEKVLAPTDGIAKLVLFVIIVITAWLILFGNRIGRAAWLAYLVSP